VSIYVVLLKPPCIALIAARSARAEGITNTQAEGLVSIVGNDEETSDLVKRLLESSAQNKEKNKKAVIDKWVHYDHGQYAYYSCYNYPHQSFTQIALLDKWMSFQYAGQGRQLKILLISRHRDKIIMCAWPLWHL
jgi:hypothetical protein